MRRLDDVLVTIDAIAAAVDTPAEGFSGNMQIAFFTIGSLTGKIFLTVAAQAAVIGQLGIIRLCENRAAQRKLQSCYQEEKRENSEK
jgi:hypothetical protein